MRLVVMAVEASRAEERCAPDGRIPIDSERGSLTCSGPQIFNNATDPLGRRLTKRIVKPIHSEHVGVPFFLRLHDTDLERSEVYPRPNSVHSKRC